jgi:hypothetical protein
LYRVIHDLEQPNPQEDKKHKAQENHESKPPDSLSRRHDLHPPHRSSEEYLGALEILVHGIHKGGRITDFFADFDGYLQS